MTTISRLFTAVAWLMASTQFSTALAQATAEGTPFLYRGHLSLEGTPTKGTYDLTFSLFEAPQGGTATAGPITNSAVKVRNGLFAVTLDFGPGPFTSTNYWLDINVRTNGSGVFTELSPRRELTPSPYAHGPERMVSSVMRLPQPQDTSKHPHRYSGPGPAQDKSSSSNLVAPVPKPGPSQNPSP